jgi:hypothetical protein
MSGAVDSGVFTMKASCLSSRAILALPLTLDDLLHAFEAVHAEGGAWRGRDPRKVKAARAASVPVGHQGVALDPRLRHAQMFDRRSPSAYVPLSKDPPARMDGVAGHPFR